MFIVNTSRHLHRVADPLVLYFTRFRSVPFAQNLNCRQQQTVPISSSYTNINTRGKMEGLQDGDSFSDVTLRFTSEQKLFALIPVRPKSVLAACQFKRMGKLWLVMRDVFFHGKFSFSMPGK